MPKELGGWEEDGRVNVKEQRERKLQGYRSAATVTVTVYPLHLLFSISYIYTYTYTYKRIPHFSGDGTTAASTAATVESQALHSYINVYIIDASKPPPTESSCQCVGGARRVVFGGGMFVRATFKPSTEID